MDPGEESTKIIEQKLTKFHNFSHFRPGSQGFFVWPKTGGPQKKSGRRSVWMYGSLGSLGSLG